MSTANYESKPCVSKASSRPVQTTDESTFDGRKIKREENDICLENGKEPTNTGNQTKQMQRPPSGRLTNGFHDADLVQDILTAKFTSLTHHASAPKHDKFKQLIEDSISEESRLCVHEIFSQIEQLKIEEKLLLYLKLPSSLTTLGGTNDPLRQPLNPLGNRYEIHQTIMWIKTHLEEDPDVSLPKQEVYDEYNMYCIRNSMKPLSTADFGKVMKQVYPRVRPRRLGTRGNSRYCYAGMRKRMKLEPPILPVISGVRSEEEEENFTEEMLGAASMLIREWAEKLLGVKFSTLSALARHLVDNLYVDKRSLAAVCILCASGKLNTYTDKELPLNKTDTLAAAKSAKLREAQLQLQRKLQQREHIKDQKHRCLDTIVQNQSKEKNVDTNGGANKGSKKARSNRSPQGTNASAEQATVTKISLPVAITGRQKKIIRSISQPSNEFSPESNCDTILVQSNDGVPSNSASILTTTTATTTLTSTPTETVMTTGTMMTTTTMTATTTTTTTTATTTTATTTTATTTTTNCNAQKVDVKLKNSRKRANSNVPTETSQSSPEKQTKLIDSQVQESVEHSNALLAKKLSSTQRPGKISVILASNLKPNKCKTTEAARNQPTKSCDIKSSICSGNCATMNGCSHSTDSSTTYTGSVGPTTLTKNQIELLGTNSKNEKLCTIDTDAFDDYLNGGNNSQEQEEELLQYFQQSSSSSSDVEASIISAEPDHVSRSDKVSQLRLILQQNLKSSTIHQPIELIPTAIIRQNIMVDKREVPPKHTLITPTLVNHHNQSSTRRRVSFETNVVEHSQDSAGTSATNTIPQSPNTRRRIFNFTPISPGPHSPINGRASKCNSANASPFVSPRNTPVPRSRSNLQAGCSRSRISQKVLSRSMSCSVPVFTSKNDTFVVPISSHDVIRHISMQQSQLTSTKSSEVQVGTNSTPIPVVHKQEETTQCPSFLSSDLTPQKQLLINYPSQENLQEIKNVYQKNQPTDQEISELFHGNKSFVNDPLFYRSQSVPLHRMVNPALMSPISTQQSLTNYQSQSFNPSAGSSVAPTPVPSEFNDFGTIGQSEGSFLLDDVGSNFITEDQSFLMGDKEMTPENITNILNILREGGPESLQILPNQPSDGNHLIESDVMPLEVLPSSNLNLSEDTMIDPNTVLDTSVSGTLQKIIQSRSYPNTPLPMPLSTTTNTYTAAYTEDSNGSSFE
ncbi:uncharacterized protein [Prorops nasuta]|uniref:uncharacterized protein isoform X2 n=1 Tax=Prorops nasuta TaxID=863751 RepID=UPI0034CE772C